MITSCRSPLVPDHVPQTNGSPSGVKAAFTGLPAPAEDLRHPGRRVHAEDQRRAALADDRAAGPPDLVREPSAERVDPAVRAEGRPGTDRRRP